MMPSPKLASSLSAELHCGKHNGWAEKLSSRIGYTCELDVDQVTEFPCVTCLGCSLGESWCSPEGIQSMKNNGMNVLKLKLCALGSETCRKAVKISRELDEQCGYKNCTAIALDLVVDHIRTGFFANGPGKFVKFKEGDKLTLTLNESYRDKCTKDIIFINTSTFPQFIHHIRKGDRIFLGDGLVSLTVVEIGLEDIECLVDTAGPISDYQRVIIPRERLRYRHIDQSYTKNLEFAAELGVDFVFTSYAENAEMILEAKSRLPATTKVFANIETKESVRNIHEIIEHADGIVISRVDLAIPFAPEKIFKLQKYIIAHCNVARRPVFVTAQLLDSMYNKPRPTRAEASDVANAVLDGADGLVLTVETAEGMYPREALSFMRVICREAEMARFHKAVRAELIEARETRGLYRRNAPDVTAASAVEAAEDCRAKAILVFTYSGESAKAIATAGASCPVIAIMRDVTLARHVRVYRGLFPFVFTGKRLESWSEDLDQRINAAIEDARSSGFVKAGDNIVIVTGTFHGTGNTNTMQVFQVPSEPGTLKIVSSKRNLVYPDSELVEMRKVCSNGGFEVGPNGLDVLPCPL